VITGQSDLGRGLYSAVLNGQDVGMTTATPSSSSDADGSYPRPQLRRDHWTPLDGPWRFAHDDADVGLGEGWFVDAAALDRVIQVPFPPESPASGIGDPAFHPIVWFARTVTAADLSDAGLGDDRERLVLHFGAVDYRASVWWDGQLLGHHEGGQSPFEFELTDAIGRSAADDGSAEHLLVVRAEDDPHDASQPRGKQDWLERPHVIWYHRTTGIWQPVWLEAVPRTSIRGLAWRTDLTAGRVELELDLSRRPGGPVTVSVQLAHHAVTLADTTVTTTEPRITVPIAIAALGNGQHTDSLLWSPESPTLIDADIMVRSGAEASGDRVRSYLGLRHVGTAGGRFTLNHKPYFVRSVLEQGYWPESHLAAPSADALRDEVQLIKDLGFNAARLHEKAEDPRLLYWADRLGLLVWGEFGSAYEFGGTAVLRTAREWMDIVVRDRSHPCVVTWVPLNESWGVQRIAEDPAQQHFAKALYHLTKALDGSRPVISNDGWEHVGSDLLTIHDYTADGDVLAASYWDAGSIAALVDRVGPAGRMLSLQPLDGTEPVMLTEFGGVRFAPAEAGDDRATWGYSTAQDAEDFELRLRSLLRAVHASSALSGFCYTQLTDTMQEANGLTDEHRTPKLPLEVLSAIVRGTA
jgi:beta-galactosidase/beta-glucuronidase